MIKVKLTESKRTPAKKNITITGVTIQNNNLVDEDGPIASAIEENLPDGVDSFTLKMTLELPDEDED